MEFNVKVFDNKNKQVGELEVENDKAIGSNAQKELLGYCKVFVSSRSALLEITEKV